MTDEDELPEILRPIAYLSREDSEHPPDLCLEFRREGAGAMIWIGYEDAGEHAGKQIIAWHMVGDGSPSLKASCVVAEGFPLQAFIDFIRKR